MKIETWQRIAAQIKVADWYGDLDDDCTADWAGLLLRAERMDKKDWWWAIFDKESGEEIASSNIPPTACASGEEARRAAETAVRDYLTIKKR